MSSRRKTAELAKAEKLTGIVMAERTRQIAESAALVASNMALVRRNQELADKIALIPNWVYTVARFIRRK